MADATGLDGVAIGTILVDLDMPNRDVVEQFLYREARLADENRYVEWLELWAEDALYWVPANHDEVDPRRELSIIYDDRHRLEERVFRLSETPAHSQDPKSRMRRVLSNIEIAPVEGQPDLVRAAGNFILNEVRRGHQSIYAGRNLYTIRVQNGQLNLVSKKVLLVQNNEPLGNLTFLL